MMLDVRMLTGTLCDKIGKGSARGGKTTRVRKKEQISFFFFNSEIN